MPYANYIKNTNTNIQTSNPLHHITRLIDYTEDYVMHSHSAVRKYTSLKISYKTNPLYTRITWNQRANAKLIKNANNMRTSRNQESYSIERWKEEEKKTRNTQNSYILYHIYSRYRYRWSYTSANSNRFTDDSSNLSGFLYSKIALHKIN